MRNYNTHDIVNLSKFDNFELLKNRYFALLFYTLTTGGITYSTGRNGVLAQVKIDERGFINYVQPCIGKWNFKNTKYQRRVSPDFVLYLFNNHCLTECLFRINELSEPIQVNSSYKIELQGIDIEKFSIAEIIKKYELIETEEYKYKNGLPNNYNSFSPVEIQITKLFYSLIERVIIYSREFAEHYAKTIRAKELRSEIDNGTIEYDNLTEEEQDLVRDDYDYPDDPDNDYFLTLGRLNDKINIHAAKALIRKFRKMKKLKVTSEELSSLDMYDDPISADYYNDEWSDNNDDDDEYTDETSLKIDYTNAKEFLSDYKEIEEAKRRPN